MTLKMRPGLGLIIDSLELISYSHIELVQMRAW